MKEITCKIRDPKGFHARATGDLVREIKKYQCKADWIYGDQTVDARNLFDMMCLGVQQHDTVTLRLDGADEEAAYEALHTYLDANL